MRFWKNDIHRIVYASHDLYKTNEEKEITQAEFQSLKDDYANLTSHMFMQEYERTYFGEQRELDF
jgi:hypothetical protein